MAEHSRRFGRVLGLGSKLVDGLNRVRKSPRSGERSYSGSRVLRQGLARPIPRFVFLTIAFLILISLMAFAEALVLWYRWPQFANQGLPPAVSIGDFAVSPSGEWGVSRISFNNGKFKEPTTHDLVLHNLGGQDAVRLHIARCRPQYVAVSPVSDDLAITCSDGSIRIWSGLSDCERGLSVADERLRPFAQTSDYLTRPAFSPDGGLLAAVGSRFIHVWRWPSGELLQMRPIDELAYAYLSFSGDSQHVLSAGSKGEVCLWDAYTGRTVKAISPDNGFVVNAALSPDAEFVALLLFFQEVRVYRLASGKELWRETRSTARGPSITYSLDGRFLATTDYHRGAGTIILLDAISGQTMCELRGHDGPISGLAFGSDGFLYSSDLRGVLRSWNIEQQREQWHLSTLEWGSNNRLFRE